MQSINPEAFEIRADGSCVLVGGYSASSDKYHFPVQDCCPYTGATDIERVELSTCGTLWAHTAVTAAPPGYAGPVPYGFGVVELTQERLRVITLLRESDPLALRFGQHMRLATFDAGARVLTWCFESDRSE